MNSKDTVFAASLLYDYLKSIPDLTILRPDFFLCKQQKSIANVLILKSYYGHLSELITPSGNIRLNNGIGGKGDFAELEKGVLMDKGITIQMIYPNIFIKDRGHMGPYYIITSWQDFNYNINNYPNLVALLQQKPIFSEYKTYDMPPNGLPISCLQLDGKPLSERSSSVCEAHKKEIGV